MTCFITPFCISAYIIRQTSEGPRYLLIRRCGKYLTGTWQMISGGIEKGETAGQAAFREIQEETGLTPQVLYSADAVETFYLPINDKIAFVPVYVAFVKDEEVTLSPKEHDAYEWLSLEEARERLIWSEQKRIITLVHETFVLQKPNDFLKIDLTYSPAKQKAIVSRTGVYAIARSGKKILLVKQQNGPHSGKWDLPGGGIEAGETIEQALRREFKEEVGMIFDTMKFIGNITASTEGLNEQGDYLLHQIGLIYALNNITPLQNSVAEMEHTWIDPESLQEGIISPLVKQAITLFDPN